MQTNPIGNELSVQSTHGATPEPYSDPVKVTRAIPQKLVRLPIVEERVAASKSSIYAWVKAGTFPAPVRLSARAVAWREEDIDRWISGRVATGGR